MTDYTEVPPGGKNSARLETISTALDCLTAGLPGDARIDLVDSGDSPVSVASPDDLQSLLARDPEPYVSTTSAGLVSFLYQHVVDAVPDEWRDLTLPPTLVLAKGRSLLIAYALTEAQRPEDVRALAEAMGCDLDVPMPLPGANGWAAVYVGAAAGYSVEDLSAMFCADPPTLAPARVIDNQVGDFGTLHDARILAPVDLNSPELQQEMTISTGANFKSVKWKPDRMTVRRFVEIMATHPEGKQKDGPGFVLGEIVGDNRRKQAVTGCYGVGLDIDVGMPGREIDAALAELGCLAVRYTTFSHAKTTSHVNKDKLTRWCGKLGIAVDNDGVIRFLREASRWHESVVATASYTGDDHTPEGLMACISHAPMEKHRVIMPLAEAFVPTRVAETHAEGMKMWASICKAAARRLGDLPMDNSAVDPSRLFYFPRHLKGKPHESTVFGGPLLDWRSLDLDGGGPVDGDGAGDAFDRALAAETGGGKRSKSRSTTDEGKALGRWCRDHAEGFQIVDVIRDHAESYIRTNGAEKVDIECPFDEDHSNPGDAEDRGCFAVNAGADRSTIFVIKCQHDSCQQRTNLDFVGKMIKDEWFSAEVLADPDYNPQVGEDAADMAAEGKARERQESAKLTFGAAVERLKPLSTDTEVETALGLLVDARLDPLPHSRAISRVATKLKVAQTTVRQMLAVIQAERHAEAEAREPAGRSAAEPTNLGYALPAYAGKMTTVRYADRPYFAPPGGEALCSLFSIVGAARFPDRDNHRDVELALLNEEGRRETVRIPADSAASRATLISVLRGRSMGFASEAGEVFVHRLLMKATPVPRVLYDAPGWRDGIYIAASGAVVLGDPAKVGLSEAGLGPNSAPPAQGTFADWQAGAKAICDQTQSMSLKAALILGFMGPVLALAGNPPVVFMFTGPPGGGKSFRQEVGVGVSGPFKAGVGQLRSMKGTENGLEIPLRRSTAGILALDEMKGKSAEEVQDLIFMIYGGVGKSRMTREITEQGLSRWDGCVVTMSTEVGVAQQLRQSHVLRAGGLSSRMIEVFVEDAEHITDKETFAEILKARDNYGCALPPFIEALKSGGYIDEPQKLHVMAQTVVERLNLADHSAKRSATALAYLEVAGEIAKDAGLLPDDTDVQAVVDHIWAGFRDSELGDTDLTGRAIQNIVAYLISHRGSTVIEPGLNEESRGRPTEAWIMPLDPTKCAHTDERVYVIPVAELSKMAAGGAPGFANDADVKKALAAKGYAIKSPRKDKSSIVWRGFASVGAGSYVVLRASMIEEVDSVEAEDQAEESPPEAT